MATVVVGYMCAQITIAEGTGKQVQPKSGLLPEAIIIGCNRTTTQAHGCAKFDAHTHYHCQVINNNRYYPVLTVAMATILVDST